MAKPLAKLVSTLTPKRRWAQFSLATVFIIMTTICVLLGMWVNRAHRQRDAVLLKVVIHASKDTTHAEVVNVLKALADVKVANIDADVSLQQTAGVSATIQARSDTPYNAVARALEALQTVGVCKTTLTRRCLAELRCSLSLSEEQQAQPSPLAAGPRARAVSCPCCSGKGSTCACTLMQTG